MNKQRRKWIEEIRGKLGTLKDELSGVLDEEQEYFDNMPVGFQSGTAGEAAQMAISAMDNAVCQLEEAIDSLGEID